VPKHYVWAFHVNEEPGSSSHGFPRVRVAGSGSGTFSIAHSSLDADGTVTWQIVGAKGSISLATASGVFLRATVTGGNYGGREGDRRVPAYRVAHPALPELGDIDPLRKGDLDDAGVDACAAGLAWDSVPPALIVTVHPA